MDHGSSSKGVTCLLTHKCSIEIHSWCKRLADILDTCGICILRAGKNDIWCDPFDPGEDIDVKIETFGIEVLLFLVSPDSLRSSWCKRELAAAQARRLPIFAIRLEGPVPDYLSHRIYLDLSASDDERIQYDLGKLATVIHNRVALFQQIKFLSNQTRWEREQSLKRISEHHDRTVLAEFSRQLADAFYNLDDPTTHFWIAIAIGQAGTPEAGLILLELAAIQNLHPHAYQGVIDGLEMVQSEIPQHKIAPQLANTIKILKVKVGGLT